MNSLDVYRELAEWYERQGQAPMRDRFLVLAADAALAAGLSEQAENLRQRLLQGNPHHLLKPYRSFAEALQTPDIQTYVQDLRVNYPLPVAEDLLRTLQASADTEASDRTLGDNAVPPGDDSTLSLDEPPPPAPKGPAAEPEGLKVYPIRDEAAPPRPLPQKTAAHPPRPAAPKAPATNPAARATAPLPRPAPLRPANRAPEPLFPPEPPEAAEPEGPGGVWLTLMLFGLVCTAGLILALFTLARPFWPAHWLP